MPKPILTRRVTSPILMTVLMCEILASRVGDKHPRVGLVLVMVVLGVGIVGGVGGWQSKNRVTGRRTPGDSVGHSPAAQRCTTIRHSTTFCRTSLGLPFR